MSESQFAPDSLEAEPMAPASQPFISFYDSIGFAPTRQKSMDPALHQFRRRYLYRCLGVAPFAVRNSSILDLGPGSGENSLDLLTMTPASLTLVDGSEAVLANLRSALDMQAEQNLVHSGSTEIRLIQSDISTFSSASRYDLVICEGVLPLQMRPRDMASHVLSFVRPGGGVIFTCFDAVSGFSEVTRRFIASVVFGELRYSKGLVNELIGFFAADFEQLSGMSRSPQDWVLDSLINPWLGDFFSIEDALTLAKGDFALLGSSPDIFSDWRWYKDPTTVSDKTSIEMALSTYRANLHNLIDARVLNPTPMGDEESSELTRVTSQIALRIRRHIHESQPYELFEFARNLNELLVICPSLGDLTKQSVRALISWCANGTESDLRQFRGLWGRGQQYISFVHSGSSCQDCAT